MNTEQLFFPVRSVRQDLCRALAMAVSGLCSISASAGSPRIECPTEIPERSVKVASQLPGWQALTIAPLYLNSAGATGGPPEKRALLIETTSTYVRGATKWSDTYTLAGAFPEGKWFECRYGMLNEVVLARRLDDKTTMCRLSYRKGQKAGQNDITVDCH